MNLGELKKKIKKMPDDNNDKIVHVMIRETVANNFSKLTKQYSIYSIFNLKDAILIEILKKETNDDV